MVEDRLQIPLRPSGCQTPDQIIVAQGQDKHFHWLTRPIRQRDRARSRGITTYSCIRQVIQPISIQLRLDQSRKRLLIVFMQTVGRSQAVTKNMIRFMEKNR